jgi:ABC-type glutathione transport system ATPase component
LQQHQSPRPSAESAGPNAVVNEARVAVAFDGVGKTYGSVRALDGLSFQVEEGRFFALFGPSSVCARSPAW